MALTLLMMVAAKACESDGCGPAPRRRTSTAPVTSFGEDLEDLGYYTTQVARTFSEGAVWPLGAIRDPDLPQSSPFGPRLKASEEFRVDFHRGVDIPCEAGVDVLYAIADGKVSKAGNDPNYSDMIIQIKHSVYKYAEKDWRPKMDKSIYRTIYVNYLHVYSTDLVKGQPVKKGDAIGICGGTRLGTSTAFGHLHFETRAGCGWQRCNVNPWGLLPHLTCPEDPISVTVVEDSSDAVEVSVSQRANCLVWDALKVEVVGADGEARDELLFSLNGVNYRHTVTSNPGLMDTVDLPTDDDRIITLEPAAFSSRTTTSADYTVTWLDAEVGEAPYTVIATVYDVFGVARDAYSRYVASE